MSGASESKLSVRMIRATQIVLVLACLAMLLSPDQDLDHVFRSRFDRLLLHWVGVGWLLVSAWLFQVNHVPK